MEEPTKADIDTIFKRLKAIPANKVCQSSFVYEIDYEYLCMNRHVLIVMQKIPPGHQSPMEYLYALIVQPDIVVLVFIYRLFVRLISILAGDGFSFGKF